MASNLDDLLLLNLMNPPVSGLFIKARCDPDTSVCVICKFPNRFTFPFVH